MTSGKKILYCVLNWGLGHATRSEVYIRQLLQENEVILASDGVAKRYLEKVFPELQILEMPSYNIKYGNTLWSTRVLLLWKSMMHSSYYKREQAWVREQSEKFGIEEIISDGRLGAFCKGIPSAYMTHQLQMQSGMPMLDIFINYMHRRFMRKFDRILIPDYADRTKALAGELSLVPRGMIEKCVYVGPLSRLTNIERGEGNTILCICSGPEPQRSILEEAFIEISTELPELDMVLIRGKENGKIFSSGRLQIIDLADGEEMRKALASSAMVLVRSGYSSIMDLKMAGIENVIWIPTPGQGEQEYLGKYLAKKKWGLCIEQKGNWKHKLREAIRRDRAI